MVSTLIPTADLAPSVTSRVLVVKAIDFTEGAPGTGSITFALPWDIRVKADGLIIQAGSKTLTFDEAGEIKIRVPTADPDTDPESWYLTVKLSWAPHSFKIRVPVGTTPINLVDVPIIQEIPAGTAPGVLLTGASATVKIGAAADVVTSVAAGVANFDFTLPDYGPELDKVEVERLAAQAAKVDAQTAATASATSAGQSAASAAASAASAAQAAAPTDTVVNALLTSPTSLARRALDSAVADKRNVAPAAITAGLNADLLRAPDTYHFRTDEIAAASTGLPVPLAGFLDVTASARARRNSLYNSGPRSTLTTGWNFQAGTGEAVTSLSTPTTPNDGPEGRTGFIRRGVVTQRTAGTSGWFYRAAAGEVVGGIGDTRTLSMWVRYSHPTSIALSGQLRPSPLVQGQTVTSTAVAVPANTWTRLSVTITSTAAYDGCQIWAIVQSGTPLPVGGTYDAADAQAELSPVLTPYFDGSLATTSSEIYSYEGAAYVSASLASGFIAREYRTLTGRRFTQQLTAAGWSTWQEVPTLSVVSPLLAAKRDMAVGVLPATEHTLNDYKTPGTTLLQSTSAQATIARNYPGAGAGVLDVDGSAGQIYQRFQSLATSAAAPSRVFNRTFYASTSYWSPWSESLQSETSRPGTRAARPAASAVPDGTLYVATDVQEMYVASGSTWIPTGQGGNELGRGQITSMVSSTASSPSFIAGLSVTWVAGERPVEFRFDGEVTNATAGGECRIWFNLDSASTYIGEAGGTPSVADRWVAVSRSIRCPMALTPGTTHTVKIGMTSSGTTTARVGGSATNPTSLRVVAL